MSKKKYVKASILLLFAAFQSHAQIVTTIPATTPESGMISVKAGTQPVVSFNLSTVPPGAIIDRAGIQLTLSAMTPQKMLLQMLKNGTDSTINSKTLDGNAQNDIIAMNVAPRFINPAAASLRISLSTQSETGAAFYPVSATSPGNGPRLVITYHLPDSINTWPAASWPAARADAQHTARAPVLLGGASPTSFEFRQIGDFKAIQSDPVMYNGSLYLIAQQNDSTKLWAVDPAAKTSKVLAANLMSPNMKISNTAIDPYGRLYYVSSESQATIFDLSGNNVRSTRSIAAKNIVQNPTIGADGSIYLVTNDAIYAYSPFPQLQLSWVYSGVAKSPVTMNRAGTTAYIIVSDSIIALDALNGRRIAAAKYGSTGTGIPLVNNDGYVFVPNALLNATHIDVFDADLKPSQSIDGSGISPMALGNDGVYCIVSGSLTRLTNTSSENVTIVSGDGGFRSVVADRSGNIYCLGNDGALTACMPASGSPGHMLRVSTGQSITQKAMMMAQDGSLYVCSSSGLYTFRSPDFSGAYTLKSSDPDLMNATFRGSDLAVPEGTKLGKQQVLVGANSVSVGPNVVLDRASRITIETAGSISIGAGFQVRKGVVFSCKTGY